MKPSPTASRKYDAWPEPLRLQMLREYETYGAVEMARRTGVRLKAVESFAREYGLRFMDFAHVADSQPAVLPHRVAQLVKRELRKHDRVRLDLGPDLCPVVAAEIEPTLDTICVYVRGASQEHICEDVTHRLLELAR